MALVCASTPLLRAQTSWQSHNWTTEDGLPQSTVHAIRQTRDGYLWFTTLGGLVRYDGLTFHVVDRATAPGLLSNRFTTIYEDHAGDLWAGTEDGIVSRLSHGTIQSFRLGAPSNSVCSITEVGGVVWVLANEGFYQFDRGRFAHRVPGFKAPFGYGYNQGFAYATGSALELIRPEARRTIDVPAAGRPYTDQSGNVWVMRDANSVVCVRGATVDTIPLHGVGAVDPASVTAAMKASDGAIWIAIDGKGIVRMTGSAAEWIVVSSGIGAHPVTTFFEDREGSIWAGTLKDGLTCLRRRALAVLGPESGLTTPNIYPLVATPGGVLAGSWGGGVFRIANGRADPVGPRSGWILSILEEPDGTLWTSAYGSGVVRWRGGERRAFSLGDGLPNLIVPVLFRDRTGRIWAGTNDGLSFFDRDRFRTVLIAGPPAHREIHVMAEDRDGSILVGTRGGLLRLRDGRVEVVADERTGLSSGNVRAIHVDGDGTLWIGTYDGGLDRIRRGWIVPITRREGLYDNGVFSIVEDAGFFWMSCNRGIYRVSRAELNAVADGALHSVSAYVLTRRDGLASAECNGGVQSAGCRTPDGRLWFPTQQGIAIVDPSVLHAESAPPPVVITGAAVDGKDVPVEKEVRVAPGGKRVELQFASLTLADAERTRYRYMLDGLDRAWTQVVRERSVTYPALPPGRYRFLVSAANEAGRWDAAPAGIDIVVLPPFWQTWWFDALVVLVALGIVLSAFLLRLRSIEQRRAAQAEFSRRLLAQQEEERKRIASELHDSLGQNLLVIKNRALLAAERERDPEMVDAELTEIATTASTAIDEVRRIAYNLRPAELDHLGVTKAIDALLRRIGTATSILFCAQIDPIDGVLSKRAEVQVFRIVQEWVSNIVRHSNATAALVTITNEQPHVTIRIRDDGVGFPPAQTGGRVGLGTQSIAERAKMLGGTSEIVSARGEGTTLTVRIDARSLE